MALTGTPNSGIAVTVAPGIAVPFSFVTFPFIVPRLVASGVIMICPKLTSPANMGYVIVGTTSPSTSTVIVLVPGVILGIR
ncbi:MAG: hypothetical protein BWX58_00012 [Deltaproteobacteria bacterium ADurb.Bin026]|nr:MAG: hypothetical protein BWX58_00012 [Deltaproteobacteria bacterium ADurb.Bin026]